MIKNQLFITPKELHKIVYVFTEMHKLCICFVSYFAEKDFVVFDVSKNNKKAFKRHIEKCDEFWLCKQPPKYIAKSKLENEKLVNNPIFFINPRVADGVLRAIIYSTTKKKSTDTIWADIHRSIVKITLSGMLVSNGEYPFTYVAKAKYSRGIPSLTSDGIVLKAIAGECVYKPAQIEKSESA